MNSSPFKILSYTARTRTPQSPRPPSQLPRLQFKSMLVDNLNAEIVLGTVSNVREASTWLSYTWVAMRPLRPRRTAGSAAHAALPALLALLPLVPAGSCGWHTHPCLSPHLKARCAGRANLTLHSGQRSIERAPGWPQAVTQQQRRSPSSSRILVGCLRRYLYTRMSKNPLSYGITYQVGEPALLSMTDPPSRAHVVRSLQAPALPTPSIAPAVLGWGHQSSSWPPPEKYRHAPCVHLAPAGAGHRPGPRVAQAWPDCGRSQAAEGSPGTGGTFSHCNLMQRAAPSRISPALPWCSCLHPCTEAVAH